MWLGELRDLLDTDPMWPLLCKRIPFCFNIGEGLGEEKAGKLAICFMLKASVNH